MEVGASLIAFIGFGLTSIKTFHKFVTSIKDGPQRLQDLARALDSLRAAYERTQALQELPGILESSPSLLEQLRRCNDDVDRFSKTLVKMQIQPGERLYSTLRKKFKLPLCEDEIRDMLGIFSGHVSSFTLEISVLDIRIAHRNSSGISQVITGSEHQFNMMKQQHTSLEEIKEDVFRSSSQIEHVQTVVNALALKVESLPAVSTQHSTSILDMLAKLEGKVNELSLREQKMFDNTSRSVSAFDIAPSSGRILESSNARVVVSIRRLSALLENKNQIAEFDEAEGVIDDLETLLQQMDKAIRHMGPGEPISHRTGFQSVEKEHRKEMKQALRVLKGISKLKVNPQVWSRRDPPSGRLTNRQDNVALYQSQLGDWLVSTRRQWRICETQADDEEHQEYTATIAFKPIAQVGSHHIKVSIQQLQQVNGFYSFTPVVSIGRIRPSNSRVFQCIKLGLFDEFFQLIATGEASLQDRDEKGASLLHYAHSQPEICCFLIKHGADVDELANISHVDDEYFKQDDLAIPLDLASLFSWESSHRRCTFSRLLAAGADPTLPDDGGPDGLHFSLAHDADEDMPIFESLLSVRGIFFNVNDQDTNGQTLIHRSLINSGKEYVSALIKVGADINAKNFLGQSCLQYLVHVMRMVGGCLERDHDSLHVLMEAGANIFSRDYEGRSIWETAIENQQEGSYARDALDSVLVSYGYHAEVVEFAEKLPRHGAYTDRYRRYHFDLMWEGNEHLCPYYNDEALGHDLECFDGIIEYTPSDSSSNTEELEDEGDDDTDSEDEDFGNGEDEASGSDEGEEPESQHTESNEANDALQGSEVDSESESATGSGSQSSPSRYLHEVLRDSEQQVPLSASVASWLSTSRSPGEAVLDNASPRGEEEIRPLSYGFDVEHADEIFHNPWAEG